jgi:predicted lysophospholipase L1 biosynthesis ABC-type transport system permease subunit
VGRRFRHADNREYEVIGVAADTRTYVDQETLPVVYRPYWDGAPERTVIVARSAGDPLAIAGAVRAAIRRADPDVPVAGIHTMREVLDASVSARRFQMLIASLFAVCALLLAALGIYGVVSYAVARQTRDIGVRAALGARPMDLCGMVLLRGMAPVGLGLLLGVAGALAAGRLLGSLLYEVGPYDPLTLGAVVLTVVAVAAAACYLPARRAARVDPMMALRYE